MNNKRNRLTLSTRTQAWFLFAGITCIYLVLVIPTVRYLGISWDEEIDLRIARAYLTLKGLFFGVSLDNSQTRLPMFLVALVFRVFGVHDLFVARLTSVFVGWLAILGVYIYGKTHFSQVVGLLAAMLLATSPFFLSFARVAFTESDIYLACTLSWLIVTVSYFQEKPTVGRAAIAGLVLGFSISTKATVIVIIPAIWLTLYISQIEDDKMKAYDQLPTDLAMKSQTVLLWAGWALFVLVIGILSGLKLNIASFPSIIRLIHYGLVCMGWVILFVWLFSYRNHTARMIPLACLIIGVGLLTFLIFPPDHLTNNQILQSLFMRAESEISFSLAYAGELAAQHLLTILFKCTLFLGACLLIAAFVSILRWREFKLLPILILGSYFIGLLMLPLGQTFYTVPILPILAILAAYQFMRLWSKRRRAAYVVTILAIGWWSMEMIQSYPDYHLNGYQWLGNRVLFGRSSIGYRSVVFTPADGVQQAVEWLNANVEPGQVVQLYVAPLHIVRALAPEPPYLLTNGYDDTLQSDPDYVVVHINDTIWSGNGRENPVGNIIRYPYDREILEQEYEKVFNIQRAFGIEMVSIWQHK